MEHASVVARRAFVCWKNRENKGDDSTKARVSRSFFTVLFALLVLAAAGCAYGQQVESTLPISQRQTINLAAGMPQYVGDASSTSNAPQSNWWFENSNNSTAYSTTGFSESSDTSGNWMQVGLPYDANIPRTFINQTSGGGQGSLTGNFNWYRLHFKVDPTYAGQKFLLKLEGSHTGVQVFINGTLLPGVSAVAADAQATHVVGFVPVVVDLTPYIVADGKTDNVIAIDVSRGAPWYEQPNFSGAFRFGQAMAGLFRNVKLYITNPIHIPPNVYSNQKTWGTYVGTVSEVPAAQGTATAASAVVDVQTNVVNETSAAQQVTLTTQIVDAKGNVVVTAAPVTQTVPAMTASTFPSGATPMFDQKITVPNPTLWYPNNATCGTPPVLCGSPYLYKVYHIVSVNGVVVDSTQDTLGIRTITWDANFPYFNGHAVYLWGGSGRYDYPGLGSSVPDEQVWRDMAQLAAQGGNVYRPGHSTSSAELVAAADAYGIMIDQPSGDGEGYWNASSDPTADDLQLKQELHRDMIIRDRSHPSILDWERDNGGMNATLADELGTIETTWDNINPRESADRTYSPSFGFMDECDGAGCEAGKKQQNPNNPAFGAEYWDNMGTGRGLAYDYELAFAAPYLDDWRKGRAANAFGMAQWYFAESPGEVSLWAEYQNQPNMVNFVRSLGYSSTDANRFPRLLYYIYQANWIPYTVQPVVHLAHHWNRAYEYTTGTPIQENAFSNCPSVRLLINGVPNDPVTGTLLQDQTPNPWTINSSANLAQNTTVMPGQVHWMVNWAPGTVTAECLDANGNPVAGVSDTRTTAGAEAKIVLSVVPDVTKPDGANFQWTANGSDAAFVVAEVEDADGNLVPTAADNVTFSVTGPATYMGGTQQLVADPSWTNYYQDAFSEANSTVIQGVPYAFFHSPGDPELNFEGGLQKIALRSTFTPGTVTVTATAPGLESGSVTLTSVVPPATSSSQAPAIIVAPVSEATTSGYTATFSVVASGSGTLRYQWSDVNGPIAGATSATYTTPATTAANNGDTYTVTIASSYGTVTSTPVTLSVDAPANVVITTQPATQSVVDGQSATLTVAATGSPTITYQWYQAGSGAIAGATQASYTTPVFTAAGSTSFYVVVANDLGSVQSSTAVVTVDAATPVSIATQPASTIVPVNEPVQFTAVVAGSAPYTYQWQFTPPGGSATILSSGTQLSSTLTYTIPAVSAANVGAYTVTVNNAASAPATSNAANITLAPPGVNLALNAVATSSSTQNACNDGTTTPPYTGTGCLGPENAVDGNLSTRWGSAVAGAPPTPAVPGVDPSWLQIDLGSVQSFNTVIINWENAYATQYQILYTNQDPSTNPTWNVAYTNSAGAGGTETLSFPSVSGRYIRLEGIQRATQYGYSVYEFQVYNVPQCGGATERYTINASNASLVKDNLTGLTWTRTVATDTAQGSQFTGVSAQNYCAGVNMRVPTQSEAQSIGGVNNATCAFAGTWSTWTTTVDPNDSSKSAVVSFDGTSAYQVTNNYPGATLCTSGTDAGAAPAITTQPVSQSVTLGQTASFAVTATGLGSLNYQWSKNGTAIAGATSSSYTTPATTAADNGDVFSVTIGDVFGVTASNAATLAVQQNTCSAAPSAPGTLAAGANGSGQVNLTWGASTAASGCAIGYTIYRSESVGFTPSAANQIATTSGTSYSDTGVAGATTYYYIVQATDVAGTSTASNTATATTSVSTCTTNCSSPDAIAISAGGPGAGYFAADEDFNGGTPSGTNATININGVTNPAPQSVYQNQRFGNFTYTLPGLTPGASYAVRLHFDEFYWTQAGQRVFNVSINGTQVLTNFDIFAAAGGQDIAIVEQFAATANAQGQIVLQFVSVKDNAAINGIEVQTSTATNTPPNAPSNLSATVASSSQINLSWTASATSGVMYTVLRNGKPVANSLTGSTYSDTSLTSSTTYSYTVEAIDSAGTSMASNTATATTFDVDCVSGCGSDALAISAGGPASGDYVADEDFNGGNASGTGATINTSGVTNPAPQSVYQHQRVGNNFSYTLTGLTAGASYVVRLHFAEFYWTQAGQRVFNVGINGTQVLSNFDIIATAGGQDIAIVEPFTATANAQGQIVLQFTTVTDNAEINGIEVIAPPPGTPSNLSATSTSGSQVNLSWAASSTTGVVYDIFRSTTSGFTPSSANQIATVNGTSYSDTGLAVNTAYYYVVEASNATGTSAPSAQASASTMAAPQAPTNLVATAASSSEIDLSWAASATSGVTYTVTLNGAVVASGLTGTVYSDTGLTAATSYTYTVEAVDAGGTSPASNTAISTTSASGSGSGTVAAPAIATAPISQTATIGQTATFSVVASGSPLTYQWYKNGAAITGATSASYTTPGTTAGDNASSFTVTVSNTAGSVNSSAATLSVNVSPSYTVVPGYIVTDLNNDTGGAWADNQIYVEILGNDPTTGVLSWVNYDGTVTPANVADNTASNALVAPNGQTYPNYAFTLAQSNHQLKLPPLTAGRIYISEGSPLYMSIMASANGGNNGYAGPNPLNNTDPNINVHYDWYEFTYGTNGGIYINTTQVNQFGLPLLLDVWGSNETFHMQVGINESIANLDQEYVSQTPAVFHTPAPNNLRILSPAETTFNAGGTNGNYFDSTIASAWAQYSTTPLTLTVSGRQFSGTSSGSTLTFTEVNPVAANVGEVFVVQLPSTQDVLECAGTMASGVAGSTPQQQDENAIQLQLENQICAATNRGVLLTPTSWANASTYYSSSPANFYSQFWHQHSVGGLAYGFSYDDNNNQSTTITTQQPEHMAFGIGW
ncbi:coagulation factor 5/8 type domain-containing protein [Dyella monticola]|uniref:Coagulation factor 5/8 type domain-containing protein n=1 Tax=Dyella monticola TaxID=1927958 RepID=A0A370X5Q6_9GAMM|nr:beta-1,3-glucanase family protein [Dyella monticola]RDS83696.1 coagulation factor 5/8 type domain-containing protein [Dyella monticola]